MQINVKLSFPSRIVVTIAKAWAYHDAPEITNFAIVDYLTESNSRTIQGSVVY